MCQQDGCNYPAMFDAIYCDAHIRRCQALNERGDICFNGADENYPGFDTGYGDSHKYDKFCFAHRGGYIF